MVTLSPNESNEGERHAYIVENNQGAVDTTDSVIFKTRLDGSHPGVKYTRSHDW